MGYTVHGIDSLSPLESPAVGYTVHGIESLSPLDSPTVGYTVHGIVSVFWIVPQWHTALAEIEIPSVENQELHLFSL